MQILDRTGEFHVLSRISGFIVISNLPIRNAILRHPKGKIEGKMFGNKWRRCILSQIPLEIDERLYWVESFDISHVSMRRMVVSKHFWFLFAIALPIHIVCRGMFDQCKNSLTSKPHAVMLRWISIYKPYGIQYKYMRSALTLTMEKSNKHFFFST